ncbi:MAG: hypothetical protein KDD40_06945 [Bdellovibrionales bacterium]|nr:hypothetical protein [Bdellovibrionales bacterium]
MIEEMLVDPIIPNHIKRLLHVSLLNEDAEVRQLTDQLRREMNITHDLNAVLISKNTDFNTTVFSENFSAEHVDRETTNDKAKNSVHMTLFTNKYTVLVQDRPISKDYNDLLTLIHELAHIRFSAFFEAHQKTLIKKLTPDLIRRTEDGEIEVNQQLYDFLNERYAFQTEFELMSATLGRYYFSRYYRYDTSVTKENYKSRISEAILKTYNITDPRVIRLKEESIADILLGRF